MPCHEASGVRSSGRWVLFPLTQPASAKNSVESRFRSLDRAQRNRGRFSAPDFIAFHPGYACCRRLRRSGLNETNPARRRYNAEQPKAASLEEGAVLYFGSIRAFVVCYQHMDIEKFPEKGQIS